MRPHLYAVAMIRFSRQADATLDRLRPWRAPLSSIWQRVALLAAASTLALSGCATNPVTGKNELSLVSEAWELNTGRNQYLPAQQSQGGQYVADPEVQRYVAEVGRRIAEVSDRQLPYEFVVLNDSTPNAWALPGGKIAINRGLLTELSSEAELAAVLSHEVVHAAARHGVQNVQRSALLSAATAATGLAMEDSAYGQIAVLGAGLGATLVNAGYGREAEREADIYGMDYMARAGYDPQGAVALQRTFVELSESQSPTGLEKWFASHPPSRERLAANTAYAERLPTGGRMGTQRYQQATAHLRKTAPAYQDYQEAKKMLSDGRTQAARRLINDAISQEPNEYLFHALLGDIDMRQDRKEEALAAYERSIDVADGFFYPHLQSGLVYQRLNQFGPAKRQLGRSIELLPTAEAYYAMGNIAQREGRSEAAERYFAEAARDTGATGQAALTSLMGLRVAKNPGAYLRTRTGLDNAGRILVEVTNTSTRSFRDVLLSIRYIDQRGQPVALQRRIAHVPPQQTRGLATAAEPSEGRVSVTISQARLVGAN